MDSGPVTGKIQSQASAPRSYIVNTPLDEVRQNRSQLKVVPRFVGQRENEQSDKQSSSHVESQQHRIPSPRRIATRSHTGVELHPPDWLT